MKGGTTFGNQFSPLKSSKGWEPLSLKKKKTTRRKYVEYNTVYPSITSEVYLKRLANNLKHETISRSEHRQKFRRFIHKIT